jgi:uncharacterized protein Yka (UPF0111/DUF47 family)
MTPPLREKIIQFFSPKGGIWFLSPGLIGKGEEQVVSDLEGYARKISQTIETVEDITKAFEYADKSTMESAVLKVQRGWEETERIRWGIYHRVTEGHLFFPDSRGDMFALINKMSLILLVMKDPQIFLVPEKPLRGEPRYFIERITATCRELALVLSRSIEYLNRDPALALQEIRRAPEHEKEIYRWVEESRRWMSGSMPGERDPQVLKLIEHLMAISHEILGAIYVVQEIAVKFV